ncbi:15323_t:CDS:2 [Funneliformis geosporum]|nr:15323_t:CDS:2 [Funneliformis geosporum]
MTKELSNIIPIDESRIKVSSGFQHDSESRDHIILSLTIDDTYNKTLKSAEEIMNNFITLLSYKEYGPIKDTNHLSYLDDTYGFKISLSSAHLDAMNILTSRFAGLKVLSVEFSERARWWLFWGGFITLFIEDVPQFIIQVIYKFNTVSYDIIPLLTFMMSSISLLNGLISAIYSAVLQRKIEKSSSKSSFSGSMLLTLMSNLRKRNE